MIRGDAHLNDGVLSVGDVMACGRLLKGGRAELDEACGIALMYLPFECHAF
jgi:hypothetical protein